MTRRIGLLLVSGLLCGGCATAPEPPPGCVIGRLTDEGATCQALRGPGDRLYTFYTDMTGYRLGEQVCLCGPAAQMSVCQQGNVINVVHLGYQCPVP